MLSFHISDDKKPENCYQNIYLIFSVSPCFLPRNRLDCSAFAPIGDAEVVARVRVPNINRASVSDGLRKQLLPVRDGFLFNVEVVAHDKQHRVEKHGTVC